MGCKHLINCPKETIYNVNIIRMSWLNNIYESIVNEISADDAYNRFYSSIPRDKYDEILNGNPAPDKFVQFLLNCARDEGKIDDAIVASQSYALLPPEAKQVLQNGVKSGEYANIDELQAMIDYFHAGGGITSKKQFAKKGYIKIKETDEAIVTCTTNYMANNHFFGQTHWCTASDREGRWDGYRMFLRYGYEYDAVLIQFKPKKKILPESEGLKGEPYPTIKEKEENALRYEFQLIQAAVEENGKISTICDFADDEMSGETLKKIVGEEAFSVLSDLDVIKKLYEIQEKQHEDEDKYQRKQEELINKRKEERRRKLEEQKRKCLEEAQEKMAVVKDESLEMWHEFVNNKIYKDPKILKEIWAASVTNDNLIPPENCYCAMVSDQRWVDDVAIVYLYPVFKENYWLDNEEDENGDITRYLVGHDDGTSYVPVFGYDNRGERLSLVLKTAEGPSKWGDNALNVEEVLLEEYSQSSQINPFVKGVTVSNRDNRHFIAAVQFGDKNILCDPRTKRIYDLGENVKDWNDIKSVRFISGKYLVVDGDYDYNNFLIDMGTREVFKLFNGKSGNFTVSSRNNILAERIKENAYRFIGDNEGNLTTFITDFSDSLNDGDTLRLSNFWWRWDGDNDSITVQRVGRPDSSFNAIKISEAHKPVFGVWGSRVDDYGNGKIEITVIGTGNDSKVILYDNGKYCTIKRGSKQWEDCDRYGVTEKDRIAQKNFKDWQNAGGHSPKAKAEMDKMWNDRFGDENSGSKAMSAWNDNDRNLDNGDGIVKYDPNFKFNTALQKFDPDKRWRGAIGIKDPEGYSKDMEHAMSTMAGEENGIQRLVNGEIPDGVRKNPWYRIGRDGKPLDQTWYDEDEIPANLSDRVVRENKINEEFNNLQSMMRRMGLLD